MRPYSEEPKPNYGRFTNEYFVKLPITKQLMKNFLAILAGSISILYREHSLVESVKVF